MTTTIADLFPSLITAEKDYRRAAAETEALATAFYGKAHHAALKRQCAAWRNYVNAGGSFSLFTNPTKAQKRLFTRV